jgi:DNA polymerase III subunit delta
MKVEAWKGDAFAANPPKQLIAVLVFGPDQGLVRERGDALARSVVADLSDAFRVAEIGGDDLERDPARLFDEAAAISMIGGRRVVRVKDASNAHTEVFKRLLAEPMGDALVVVEGGDLTKTGLRKLFEEAGNAAAVPCYLDSGRDLEEVVRRALKDANLSPDADALPAIVSRLGSDRGVTRQELEKLTLYAAGMKTVSEADVLAVMGDESELRADEVCDAAGEGDYKRLDATLERLWAAGTSPVSLLRQAMAHFQRLLLVKADVEEGQPADAAMKRLRPMVHFKREPSFKAQVSRWSLDALLSALDQLYEAEALVKTTAVPAEAATGRALLSVAALARTSAR